MQANSSESTPHSLRASVLGIPFDKNSSFLQGPGLAPPRIREAFHSSAGNYCTESGLDLNKSTAWQDAGDIAFASDADDFTQIEQSVSRLLEEGLRVLSLGGDHSITYPILRAFAKRYPQLSILHIDAHPDLYDVLDGNRFSHACPFARIMEAGLAQRLVQVGIRTSTPHQRQQAERFGVETIDMRSWNPAQTFRFNGPLYISLDMDSMDPAFAPGVSHYEPGGLSTRDVLNILQNVKADIGDVNIIGADIVEFNPLRDPQGITAAVASKFMKEILARMINES